MGDDSLEITESISNEICKFTAKGRIDSNSADKLLEKLENALNNEQKKLILNMAQVDYLSSIGVRVILKIFKQTTEAGGTFNIEKPSKIVKNILGMVALKEMLVIN
jgi:anti-sigma B factor antagonist